jgi:hypothetical protein
MHNPKNSSSFLAPGGLIKFDERNLIFLNRIPIIKPNPKEERNALLLGRETSFLPPLPKDMALTGQGLTQSQQTVHSEAFVERGSSPTADIGQILWHLPQSMQFSLTLLLMREKQENKPKRAPRGQRLLHQNREANISNKIMGTTANPLQTIFVLSIGIKTSHPQKRVERLKGSKMNMKLTPKRERTTPTASMAYLSQRGGLREAILSSLSHLAILLKISRRVPQGQIHPQKNLPKRRVAMRRIRAGKRKMGREREERLAKKARGSRRRNRVGIFIPLTKLVRYKI